MQSVCEMLIKYTLLCGIRVRNVNSLFGSDFSYNFNLNFSSFMAGYHAVWDKCLDFGQGFLVFWTRISWFPVPDFFFCFYPRFCAVISRIYWFFGPGSLLSGSGFLDFPKIFCFFNPVFYIFSLEFVAFWTRVFFLRLDKNLIYFWVRLFAFWVRIFLLSAHNVLVFLFTNCLTFIGIYCF